MLSRIFATNSAAPTITIAERNTVVAVGCYDMRLGSNPCDLFPLGPTGPSSEFRNRSLSLGQKTLIGVVNVAELEVSLEFNEGMHIANAGCSIHPSIQSQYRDKGDTLARRSLL